MFKPLNALTLILLVSACAQLDKISSVTSHMEGVKGETSPMSVSWAKNLDPVYETGNLPIHLGGPVVDKQGSRLFIADGSGVMSAFALEDGRKLWGFSDGSASHAGAALEGEQLFYGTQEGRLISRQSASGQLVWSIDLGASIESAPTISGGRLFVQLRNHQVFALDAATGKILWAYKRSVPLLTTLQRASRPTVWKNKLYVGFADGNVASFNVEEGIMLWERKISSGDKFIDVDMSATFFNDQLWIGSSSNEVHVLDPKTGRTLRTLSFTAAHEPLRFGDALIFGTVTGDLVGVNSSGKTVMKYKVSDAQVSSVSSWKSGFVVTDVEGHVFFVDSQEGKVLWHKHLGHSNSGIFSSPALAKGKLALLSSRHRLYVFQ